jgi:simple sugar transport system permease protein
LSPALPRWADLALLPALTLAAAFLLSGLVLAAAGVDPLHAVPVLIEGAFGHPEAIGFTLYYATSFVFTGLSVAIAFHAGLFNIGAEGQAYIGGLGVALAALGLGHSMPAIALPLAVVGAAAGGAAWAFLPGWLQAWRGSHIVITTIMFNFIAAALMTWLLVNVLIRPGQQSPESVEFAHAVWMPRIDTVALWFGIKLPPTPLNLTIVLALAAVVGYALFVWRTRWGYALRALGHNPVAAAYAGISPARGIVLAMTLSGALAGLMAVNELLGAQHRLLLNFVGGAGFVGIAVALIGRNRPIGICLAAVLFGALYQGGAELSFEVPQVTRDLVVTIQGLVILVCGALEQAFRAKLARLFGAT